MSQVDVKKKIVKAGIRVGTATKTKSMLPFIKETDDGLYIIDIDITISKILTAAKFINRVGAHNTMVCSSRKNAETPIEKFCEITQAQKYFGRFMPGTLTNPSLPYFIQPKLLIVSDPQADSQAVQEATNAGIPIIGISDTDNITSNLDIIIPANNRGTMALAAIFWLLTKNILQESKQKPIPQDIDYFETKGVDDDERIQD